MANSLPLVDESTSNFRIRPILEKLMLRHDLTSDEAGSVMRAAIAGTLSHASTAAFAVALGMKGESVEELAAMARVMRDSAVRIDAPEGTLDTCGTGGDGSGTFNISTATALVAAGAEVTVAKHGGRSASSSSGSADVLRHLGVNVDATPQEVQNCLNRNRIAFLFATTFHPGMRHVAAVRRDLGIRTVFNLLGPLSNPAQAKLQLLGVNRPELCELFAKVLQRLGSKAALIVCGAGSTEGTYLDEISTFGPSTVARLQDGQIKVVTIDPQKFGTPLADPRDLQAADAAQSADMIRAVLDGKRGAPRDIVALNAAAALQIAGKAATWHEGLEIAGEALDSGKAREALERLIKGGSEK